MASPETVRLSIAAAMTLGFKQGKFYRNAKLGCINLLMEYDTGCVANCLYCGQAREIAEGPDCKSLIRVEWPSYPLVDVIEAINKAAEKDSFVQRVCISTLTNPKVPEDLVKMVRKVKKGTGLKVSTLITPTLFDKKDLKAVKDAGAENITVAVDAATPELFDQFRGKQAKGPHKWDRYLNGIRDAVEVMGNGDKSAGVHLIIGLGETEEEAVGFIQSCYDLGARVHLFSFYPEKGTKAEDRKQPPLEQYRRVQLARFLIDRGKSAFDKMGFFSGKLVDYGLPKEEVLENLHRGHAFMTTGCPGCNRPFANETPSQAMQGLFRNYPFPPEVQDIQLIENQMGIPVTD